MSIFSSARERRLWFCALVCVLAIYLTLPFASIWAKYLYNQGLAAVVFMGCMMLVGITILVLGLNLRPAAFEVGVWIGITVVYLLVLFRITLPERSHLIEYSVVAAFIYEALIERRSQGRTVPVPALSAIALAAMVGTVDELIQYYLPNRHFDTTDIIFNILASVMAVVSIVILRRTRDTVEMMAQNRKSD